MADALKFCILRKFYKKVLERTICAKFVNGGGGDNISPLSKIPENGRLGLNLKLWTFFGFCRHLRGLAHFSTNISNVYVIFLLPYSYKFSRTFAARKSEKFSRTLDVENIHKTLKFGTNFRAI